MDNMMEMRPNQHLPVAGPPCHPLMTVTFNLHQIHVGGNIEVAEGEDGRAGPPPVGSGPSAL